MAVKKRGESILRSTGHQVGMEQRAWSREHGAESMEQRAEGIRTAIFLRAPKLIAKMSVGSPPF